MALSRLFKNVLARWLVVLVYAVVASLSLHAQKSSTPDLTTISLEDLAQVKVYSASRHLEKAQDAPSAVSIITAEEIRRYGWRTLAEALGSIRGFYTAYDRDYVYLGVLGVLRPGDYNSRMLLLINGHRLNDNVYDSAQIGTEFPLDMDLVERIEVVRGPSSSLFGTNAVFGVINVITRAPAGGTEIEVSGDIASQIARSGNLTATFTKGRLSGLVSGGLYRSQGDTQLYFPEFDFPQTNNGIAQNLDGDAYTHQFADLQCGRFRIQELYSNRTKQIPTAPFSSSFDTPGTYSLDRRSYVDVGYHRPISSTTDLDVRGYYDYYRSVAAGAMRPDNQPEFRGFSVGNVQWTGAEATIARQIGPHRITFGGQHEYSFQVQQKAYAEGQPPVIDDDHPEWLSGWYTQAELKLPKHLAMNAGVRLDAFSEYGESISPRLAVVYSPNGKTSLKYILGRAFRAPNAYESRYADNIYFERPAIALRPENIFSQNVVLEHTLFPWLEITSELFYNHLTRLIDQIEDHGSGMAEFVNRGDYTTEGVGFEIEAKRRSGVSIRASYVLTDGNDVYLEPPANAPLHAVKLNASTPLLRRAVGALELAYYSSQRDFRGEAIPGVVLTNITLSTKPIRRRWQLSASCYNVFNQSWYSPVGPEHEMGSIEQDGRGFRFKLSYRLPIGSEKKRND